MNGINFSDIFLEKERERERQRKRDKERETETQRETRVAEPVNRFVFIKSWFTFYTFTNNATINKTVAFHFFITVRLKIVIQTKKH